MRKTLRWAILWTLLVASLLMVGGQTQEAVAVAPCGTVCADPANCWMKCACETPEWGIKVEFCATCRGIPNEHCGDPIFP